jgi:hypothetical protein
MRSLSIASLSGFIGLLFVAGCAASPAAAGDGEGEPSAEALSSSASPDFDGAAPAKAVTLGGHAEKLGTASKGIDDAVDAMTKLGSNQNVVFLAGVYSLDAAALAAFDGTAATQQELAYDLMFRVDGSTAGGKSGFGYQEKLQETETLECGVIQANHALATFKSARAFDAVHGDDSLDAEAKRALDEDAALVVGSLLATASPSKLVQCTWSNNDDTDATALITVNEGTGMVRVLLAWAGG